MWIFFVFVWIILSVYMFYSFLFLLHPPTIKNSQLKRFSPIKSSKQLS